MKPPTLGWLPSAGLPITPRQLLRVANEDDPARRLREGLADRLGVERVSLRASGRDALRTVLASASSHTGRDEIVIAAYTCFSVPAAAVACGLRVRIVDVDLALSPGAVLAHLRVRLLDRAHLLEFESREEPRHVDQVRVQVAVRP